MYGMATISNGLKKNAPIKLPCNIECTALCEPQPGHVNPKYFFDGHVGNGYIDGL